MLGQNNGKARRARKAAAHVKGPSGQPNPMGSREFRRSPQGKQQIADYLDKMAQAVARDLAA